MKEYSFLKEDHGFGCSHPTVDPETGKPNGFVAISHSESDDGHEKITKLTSHRQWERKLDSNDMEPFFSMFNGFRHDLDNCDGFGEEDMLIRNKVIPQIKYQFKKYCHDNDFKDSTSDLYRYTADHIIMDLEDELDKGELCNSDNLKKFIDCNLICRADD